MAAPTLAAQRRERSSSLMRPAPAALPPRLYQTIPKTTTMTTIPERRKMMDSPRMFTGKTVDEATEDALATLGVDLEDVEIKVVSPGRSGILGFGGEPARIEIVLVGQAAERAAQEHEAPELEPEDEPVEAEASEAAEAAAEPSEETEERPRRTRGGRGRGGRTGRGRSGSGRGRGRRQAEAESAPEPQPEDEASGSYDSEDAYEERQPREDDGPPAERDSEAEQLVAEVLDYFLATMGVVAETYVRDDTEDGSLVFEIEGEDAGLLIGRRGETLQALQFLVRMVVSRQLGRKAYVMIDVEDYRQRRADMLRRLARRTAGRVASSGRASALDPMPPGERRIVHMSLASNNRVKTESEGEGNQRRVVILPRR